MGPGGLSTIKDEGSDSNQDSDFSDADLPQDKKGAGVPPVNGDKPGETPATDAQAVDATTAAVQ